MYAFICSFIYSLGTEQKMKLNNSQLEELFLKTILQEQKVLIGFNSIKCGLYYSMLCIYALQNLKFLQNLSDMCFCRGKPDSKIQSMNINIQCIGFIKYIYSFNVYLNIML